MTGKTSRTAPQHAADKSASSSSDKTPVPPRSPRRVPTTVAGKERALRDYARQIHNHLRRENKTQTALGNQLSIANIMSEERAGFMQRLSARAEQANAAKQREVAPSQQAKPVRRYKVQQVPDVVAATSDHRREKRKQRQQQQAGQTNLADILLRLECGDLRKPDRKLMSALSRTLLFKQELGRPQKLPTQTLTRLNKFTTALQEAGNHHDAIRLLQPLQKEGARFGLALAHSLAATRQVRDAVKVLEPLVDSTEAGGVAVQRLATHWLTLERPGRALAVLDSQPVHARKPALVQLAHVARIGQGLNNADVDMAQRGLAAIKPQWDVREGSISAVFNTRATTRRLKVTSFTLGRVSLLASALLEFNRADEAGQVLDAVNPRWGAVRPDARDYTQFLKAKGRVYTAQSRLADAQVALEEACQLNPRDREAPSLLARVFDATGEADKADAMRAQASARHQTNRQDPMHLLAEGITLLKDGDLNGAYPLLKQAIRLDDKDTTAVLAYSVLMNKMGNTRQAEATLVRGIARIPQQPRLIHALAEHYEDQNNLADAATHYEQVLALEPDNLPVLKQIVSLQLERQPEAIAGHISTLKQVAADDVDALQAIARWHRVMCDRAVERQDSVQISHHAGQVDEALLRWKKLEPKNSEPIDQSAIFHGHMRVQCAAQGLDELAQQHAGQAVERLEVLVGMSRHDSRLMSRLCRAYELAGRDDDAKRYRSVLNQQRHAVEGAPSRRAALPSGNGPKNS